MPSPPLSLIVVFHAMAREAPRTLFTLSAAYQRGVTPADYEVIAVDAGSAIPLSTDLVSRQGPNFRLLRTPPAPSPAAAVNLAARAATGQAIALCIDGARMLSPGIVAGMLGGLRMFADPVVATLAWHLDPKGQNESILRSFAGGLGYSPDMAAVGGEREHHRGAAVCTRRRTRPNATRRGSCGTSAAVLGRPRGPEKILPAGSAERVGQLIGRGKTALVKVGRIWDEEIKPRLKAMRTMDRCQREEDRLDG